MKTIITALLLATTLSAATADAAKRKGVYRRANTVQGMALPAAPKLAPLPDTPEIAELRRAFDFAFPIYEVMRTRDALLARVRNAAGIPNAVNMLFPRTTLADETAREITTPNNDTLYSTGFLDLAGGPVLLTVPALPGRYHSAALMSLTTDNTAILGTRTGGNGGTWLIAGPGWKGTPPSGAELVRSATNDAWLLVRVLVNGPDDLAAASTAVAGFRLEPAPGRTDAVPTAVAASMTPDAKTFLAVVNEAVARSSANTALVARAQGFAAQGIGNDWATLSPDVRAMWTKYLPSLRAELKGGLAQSGDVVQGWSYPGAQIGDYGDNDRLRALVALGGLAALPRVEAMYLSARADKDGAPLTGAKSYRVHIPGRLPVGAFWSLTMYQVEPDGRLFFVPNELKRFAVGDRSKHLRPERDGSYEIFVQAPKPGGERVVNWLPAPKGGFALVFRGYLPRAEFLDGSFRLPPVVVDEMIP